MNLEEKIKKVFKENQINILEEHGWKGSIKYECNICKRVYTAKSAVSLFSKISLCEHCWKPFSRWNKERLEEYKLKRLFPESDLSFVEFNGYNNPGKIKCNKCGFIKEYSSLPAVLRRVSTNFCEQCEGLGRKIYNHTIENLPPHIELIEWKGAAFKNVFLCKKCGKYFERKIETVSKLDYCPYCVTSNNKFTLEEAQQKFNEKFGTDYTILEYNGQKKRSLLRHKCGFCFTCNIGDFAKSKGCPKCFKSISKLEQAVDDWLAANHYSYERQKRFDDFKKFPYDFAVYLNGKTILIEAQGRQHYMSIDGFGDFEKQKVRDKKKRDYCLVNNIPLIEVPFCEQKNIDKFLLEQFNDYLERE